MRYTIEFADSFSPKQLRGIPPGIVREIQEAIDEKLTRAPEVFGKPLRFALQGCRRLRVGDYRVIFQIRDSTVIILDIAHRSIIYKGRGK